MGITLHSVARGLPNKIEQHIHNNKYKQRGLSDTDMMRTIRYMDMALPLPTSRISRRVDRPRSPVCWPYVSCLG
jgi:hypothetical protein